MVMIHPSILQAEILISFISAGHYLNLPVVEDDGRLVAIVDVLKLTYATLEQASCLCSIFDCGNGITSREL